MRIASLQMQMSRWALFLFLFLSASSALADNIIGSCASYLQKTPNGQSIAIARFETVNGVNRLIYDVSDYLTEYYAHSDPKLRVINLGTVFAEGKPFIGFGKPNLFVAIPNMNPVGLGYNKTEAKFAATISPSKGTKFAETNDKVQSGILLVFPELPPGALDAMMDAAKKSVGSRSWTCVNNNCHMLSNAGFTLGGEPLTGYYQPIPLFNDILQYGLEWQGQPVKYDIVRTTPGYTENVIYDINKAAYTTVCRHAVRGCNALMNDLRENTYMIKIDDGLRAKLGIGIIKPRRTGVIPREIWESQVTRIEVPENLQQQYSLGVSEPSDLGFWLRLMWGPHSLFEINMPKDRVTTLLPKILKAYPDPDPNLATRAKHAFFNDSRVKFMHEQMKANMKLFDGLIQNQLFDMLRTHSDDYPNKYNFVVTGDKLIIMKNDIQIGAVDWLLAKHILISGNSNDVRFAGEMWKTADGKIHINSNSGTYQPAPESIEAIRILCNEIFPGIEFVIHTERD